MSRDYSAERSSLPGMATPLFSQSQDPIDELYNLIANKRNTTLKLEDLRNYYEKRDKSLGDYPFDDSKFINFIEKNSNVINK
jgi:hypothetical protein